MGYRSTRSRAVGTLIRTARTYIEASRPIPLDLYAQLDAAGVDITELERTIRNG
jgi:hypothetical protein